MGEGTFHNEETTVDVLSKFSCPSTRRNKHQQIDGSRNNIRSRFYSDHVYYSDCAIRNKTMIDNDEHDPVWGLVMVFCCFVIYLSHLMF